MDCSRLLKVFQKNMQLIGSDQTADARSNETVTTLDMSFKQNKRKTRKGFALVATILLMVLLSILAVGMLSLSAVSLRSGARSDAMTEARANARVALMIAIGELQESMGPDKRISARAEILDTNPATPEADGVGNPQYLGVWDTWLTDNKGSLSIQDTYDVPGRHASLFRRWLVSGPNTETLGTAAETIPEESSVVMHGQNYVGPDASKRVNASRVPVSRNGVETGGYAWWISDEAQKARLDMEARDVATTIERAQVASTQTGRLGIEKMTGMTGFDTSPESLDKMITTGQAGISAAAVSENFHDITAYSLGLLTDVRSGGFQSDLNLAFESDVVPDEMNGVELFGGRPFDAPIRPFTGELATNNDYRPNNPYIAPMSWRSLRDYYRLYREFPGDSIYQPIKWSGNAPLTNRFLMAEESNQNLWDVAGYARQPILLRQTWVLSTMTVANPAAIHSNERNYFLLCIPVVTLWNPYNVPLEIESTEISTFGTMYYAVPLLQKVYRDDVLFEEVDKPKNNAYFGTNASNTGSASNRDLTNNQAGYRMIPTDNSLGTIRFEPGEVRVFSTDDNIVGATNLYDGNPDSRFTNRHFTASLGFTPADKSVGGLRGLSWQIDTGNSPAGEVSISLRMNVAASQIDTFWSGGSRKSVIGFLFQERPGNQQGLYNTNGNSIGGYNEYHDVFRLGLFSLDWLETNDVANAWIIEDQALKRAKFPPPGEAPSPVGIISITAKSAHQLAYAASGSFAKDFRNRSWLHAPPTRIGGVLVFDPGNSSEFDQVRADSPYQLHFTPVNGNDVTQYLEAEGRNGFFGGGFSASNGQKYFIAQDLPITPVRNLGVFSGARVSPARSYLDQRSDNNSNPTVPDPVSNTAYRNRKYYNLKNGAASGADFGAGIGNAYAHPMIDPSSVYTKHDFGVDPGWDGNMTNNFAMNDDYWDHLFLSNDALWDSWFCSGIAPEMSQGTVSKTATEVAQAFLDGADSPMSHHYQPYLGNRTAQEIIDDVVAVNNAAEGKNGWDLIAAHILNKGQFNVNSTSKEAWKALLMSMANRPIGRISENGTTSVIAADSDEVTLARHPIVTSNNEATDEGSSGAWNGIRKLTVLQIDKLAEEIVRQVKLRGPFLNMAEFINRRLSDDEMGVTGALQAAVDWDEFNAGYDGTTSGTGESINQTYKGSGDMIISTSLPASYPNEKAAMGSRYAGIPGYVMQSDILQGISTSLSVRGDTFMIRAYGESIATDGKVLASAWCEAVVQWMPEYVDPSDPADKKMRIPGNLPNDNPALSTENEVFGRKFNITLFRWLSKDEI